MSSDPTASPPPPPPETPVADASGSPSPAPVPVDPNAIDWAPYTRFAAISAIAGLVLFVIAGMINLSIASSRASTAAENETKAKEAVKAAVDPTAKKKLEQAAEEAKAAAHAAEQGKHLAKARFMSAYLSGYTYWLSLPMGAMALLMIGHLVKSSWGRLLRPLLEAATRTLPLFVVLFLGIAAATGSDDYSPYWWTAPHATLTPPDVNSANPIAGVDPENKREQAERYGKFMIEKAVAHEREGRDKGNYGFLSTPAFFGVGLVLFAIWGGMIHILNKWGHEVQGTPAQVEAALTKLNKFSGPGIIVYAITATAAATQWVMSVEPGWASTMFPVIFAVNQFLTTLAFCLVLFLWMASRPPVKDVMRPKFQLDMGTLMLAFTLFWTYTSFSQFMLVWVGNLPEEIPFYLKRSDGGWWYISFGLAVLHFALPFLILLFRDIKLHPTRLRTVAAYLMMICALDVIWWNAPAAEQPNMFPSWLMDVGAVAAIGGGWALYFFWQLQQRPIFVKDDMYLLPEGHTHESH